MAADGSGRMYEAASWSHLPLAHGIGPGRHIRALCRCGVQAVIDPTPWAPEGGRRLTSFEDRLRCGACGARSVPLEIWYGHEPPTLAPDIWIFR